MIPSLPQAPVVAGVNGIAVAAVAAVDREIQALAEQLARIHGNVRIAREANGMHIYCASPACLERYGRSELAKKHLAINVDKALGLGSYLMQRGTYDADLVARCMKTSTPYRLSDLLRMEPLERRGIPDVKPGMITVSDNHRSLVQDERGNMVPAPPG